MKRRKSFRKIFSTIVVACFLFNLLLPSSVFAYTVGSEEKYEEQLAEGVKIQTVYQSTPEGPARIYVMTVDLANPYVKIDALVGSDNKLTDATAVSKMTSNAGAVAGINGDFFQMDEKAPLGVTVQGGELVSSPIQRRDMYGFGLTEDNYPFIDIFKFSGQVKAQNGNTFPLYGVNKPTYLAVYGSSPDIDKLNMYTPRWGAKSRGKLSDLKGITEVVVADNTVKQLRTDQPGVAIPQNGYVLAAHGKAATWVKTNLTVGSNVYASYQVAPYGEDKLAAAVGGQAMLVNYGQRSYFTQNITGKRPRTAMGYTQDRKTMFLVVVDGGNGYRGMTQEELADYMVSLGSWQAINLDGGGSSTMAARLLGENQVSLVNQPLYTYQRSLPVGVGVFSTAPAGAFMGLKIRGERYVMVGTSRTYTAKGYDEHYNPFNVDPNQITWSIEPELGTFNGSVLKTVYSGSAMIKATANGVTESFPMRILGAEDIGKVQIIPGAVQLNENTSTNLSVIVTEKHGSQFNLKASEVQWEITGDVGSVQGEQFVAGSQKGTGQLTAIVDGVRATVPVSVGAVEKPYTGLETFTNYKFNGYPAQVTGKFSGVTISEPVFRGAKAAKLEYDFSKTSETRAAYGRFGDGLTLPGHPLGLGLWVHGSQGNNHWLRAKLLDSDDNEVLVDLARNVDWQGWQHIVAKFPANLKYPLKLSSIYLVETDKAGLDKGAVYFDELALLMPVTTADLTTVPPTAKRVDLQVNPAGTTSGSLGDYLNVSLPAKTTAAQEVSLNEDLDLKVATPGYNPILPAITVASDKEAAKPYTLAFTCPTNVDTAKASLMRWDPAAQRWKHVPQKIDTSTKVITAKADAFGTYALMQDAQPEPKFNDISNSWAKDVILNMASKRAVSGFPGDKFLPQKGVTRAEFIVLLSNVFGWSAKNPNINFKDALPAWAKDSIAAAVERGVVAGYANGRFEPNKVITRGEMAVIINNCLKLPDSDKPSAYSDSKDIPAWAVQAIRNTKVSGILKGSNNEFRPKDTASRAEATAVLAKILDYYLSL